jgi:predicted nucleic acid-binding protein
VSISLIVTDASPLITLAVASALDTLLLLRQRVIVPDMVRHEIVRHPEKPGASEVMEWIRAHGPDAVVVGSTTEYEEFLILQKTNPNVKIRNRGELAAAEILTRELDHKINSAILLFEDSDIRKPNFLIRLPDNVLVMSTSEFLAGLESAKLIKSAQTILAKAVSLRGNAVLSRYIDATAGSEAIRDDWPKRLRPGKSRS